MSSLRQRISIGVVGITSSVVLIAAIGIWLATRTVLVNGIDRDLHGRGERFHRMDAAGGLGSRRRWPGPPPEARIERPDAYRQVQFVDLLSRQDLAPSPATAVGLSAETIAAAVPEHVAYGYLSDGRHVRMLAIQLVHMPSFRDEKDPAEPIDPRPESAGALALFVVDLGQVDDELERMGLVLALLWGVATVLAWVAVLLMRSTILRPVGQLIAAIDRLGPDDLSARVPPALGPDEVRGLVQRLNVLFDRLEQAFRHEQATIANVAHELRTPVTSLRMALEFRLLAAPPAEERQTLSACLQTVVRMQEMVSNLLLLARLEAGKEPLQRQPVDLAALVAEVVESWDVRAGARQQTLGMALPERALATTSDPHLRLILDNLIGNAVNHGQAGGEIALAVAAGSGAVRLAISNPFTGAIDAQQLGKSFYRADDARSGSDHSGLGLALCRRLAALLGGDLQLTAADGRFTATLVLPVDSAATVDASAAGDAPASAAPPAMSGARAAAT